MLAAFGYFVVSGGGLRTYRFQVRLLRHLGNPPGGRVHFRVQPVETAFVVDYLLALRDLTAERGWTCALEGLHDVRHGHIPEPSPVPLLPLFVGGTHATLGPPTEHTFELGPDREEVLPLGSLHFLAGGEHPLIARVRIGQHAWESTAVDLACAETPEAMAYARAFFDDLDARARSHSAFRGEMLCPRFDLQGQVSNVEIQRSSGEDDPVLPEHLVAELEASFLAFKLYPDSFRAAGLPTQRGLLLCGPPGTGKTSTCRYLERRLPDHTFVNVNLKNLDHLEAVFGVARRLAPAVLVIDDVDLYANQRSENRFSPLLGELMAQLDGLLDRAEVDVVMTSNTWEGLERALTLRPGRIDAVLLYENPDAGKRRELLDRDLAWTDEAPDRDALVTLTEGFTPAEVRECTRRAVALAALRAAKGEGAAPGPLPTLGDYQQAARRLRENPLRPRHKTSRSLRRREATLLSLRRPDADPEGGPEASPA